MHSISTTCNYYQFLDQEVRILEAGQGTPLLLLHGLSDSAEIYNLNIEPLAQSGFKVMAVDFLGHGLSSFPITNRNLESSELVDQIKSFLESRKLKKTHIAGHGLGAWVALNLLINYPELVGKLILSSTTGISWGVDFSTLDSSGSETTLNCLFEGRSSTALENVPVHGIEQLVGIGCTTTAELRELRHRNVPTESVSLCFKNNSGRLITREIEISESLLSSVKSEVLVLSSLHNTVIPFELAEHLVTLIPGARYYCFLDSGFWPHWEQPITFNEVLVGFLRTPE